MKSSKIKIAAVLTAASFMFAGCGDALYALTPEEENAVISYASHVVAKYNTYQQDGEIFVAQQILDGEEDKGGKQQEALPDEGQQEPDAPSDVQPDPEESQGQELLSPDVPQAAADTASLGEALNLAGIQADYMGSSLCTTYEKSDSFVVDAAFGSQILVLNLNLKNQADQDAHVDILKMMPSFRITVNGTETAAAQTTILPNDLSTYQGDIPAKGTAETVLLFQIPQEIQEIDSIQLKITIDDTAHTVDL